MSGRAYLLDTNAIIQLFKGNTELVSLLDGAEFISTSIIAEMEYYSFAIIAATARANGLTIITADDHFKPLPEPWRVCFYNPI